MPSSLGEKIFGASKTSVTEIVSDTVSRHPLPASTTKLTI